MDILLWIEEPLSALKCHRNQETPTNQGAAASVNPRVCTPEPGHKTVGRTWKLRGKKELPSSPGVHSRMLRSKGLTIQNV